MRPLMARCPASLLLAGLTLATSSCARKQPIAPELNTRRVERELQAKRIQGEGTFEGEIGPGAHYVICVPENWNGALILYAHGLTAPIFPVGLPPNEVPLVDGIRAMVLQAGFAFAYSSYSQTGLGVKDAAQRTKQLLSVFRSRVGSPERTYLIGTSFGGLVAVNLVEEHPEHYSGVLTLCGMVGGTKAEIDYLSHVRVLFDYFFPGALPGNLYDIPSDLDVQQDIIVPAVDALQGNPLAAGALAQLVPTPIPLGPYTGDFIVQALVLHALELGDILDRTHGQGFFDNTQTVYAAALPAELLADVNAHVGRFSAGPAAIQLFEKYYEPTGDLQVPLVSLHTSLDPVVPAFHEEVYRSRVEARGQFSNLHQTTVDRFGHCLFTAEEIGSAFQQMIALSQAAAVP